LPALIIGGVIAMVGYANWRDMRQTREVVASRVRPATSAPVTSREQLEQQVQTLTARLADHPHDIASAVRLADAILRQTRVTGSAALSFRAEAIVKSVLADAPGNYDAHRMLATVYLSQHRFREAIDAAERNRDTRPYDPVNYGVIGDGHLELGEYAEGFDAFDRMMQLRPSAAAYARVAYARELQGNLAGAIESMKLAADATAPGDLEALAWTHSQIGDLYLQSGKTADAKGQYAMASQAFPGHPFAVTGYARALEMEGDLVGALSLLGRVAEKSPTPDVAARMGDLRERLGRHDEAEREYARAEAIWRADMPEPKNLARFLADHNRRVDEAVRIAEAAAATRHDIFTEDALAWAYFKAGRRSDAKQAIQRALRTGTRDRSILAHAAAINSSASQMAAR